MIRIFPVLLFFISAAPAWAEASFDLPIEQGNWTVSGSLAVTYNSFVGAANSASPSFEYFLVRRLSVGLVSNYYSDPGDAFWGWGPTASYHFATSQKWSFFVNTACEQNGSSLSRETVWTYQIRLGALYFLAKQVAAGPTFTYSGVVDPKPYDQTYLSLSARFWIFF